MIGVHASSRTTTNDRVRVFRGISQLNFGRRIALPGTEFHNQKASAVYITRYTEKRVEATRSVRVHTTVLFAKIVTSACFLFRFHFCYYFISTFSCREIISERVVHMNVSPSLNCKKPRSESPRTRNITRN